MCVYVSERERVISTVRERECGEREARFPFQFLISRGSGLNPVVNFVER